MSDFVTKTLGMASKGLQRYDHHSRNIRNSYKTAYRTTGGTSGHGLFLIKDNLTHAKYRINKNPVQAAADRIKLFTESYKRKPKYSERNLPRSTAHMAYIKGDNSAVNTAMSHLKEGQGFGEAVKDSLLQLRRTPGKGRFIAKVLGLEQATKKNIMDVNPDLHKTIFKDLINIESSYKERYKGRADLVDFATELIGAGADDTLMPDGIYYDSTRNRLHDFRNITPGALTRRVVRGARNMFSFGRNIDTLGIFQAHLLGKETPQATAVLGALQIDPGAFLPKHGKLKSRLHFDSAGTGSSHFQGAGLMIRTPGDKGHTLFGNLSSYNRGADRRRGNGDVHKKLSD